MGRWLSPDWSAKEEPVPYAKMDDPQSLNLYAYVGNNPLRGVDHDGHDFLTTDPTEMDNSEAETESSQSVADQQQAQQQNGQAVATVYNETGGLRPDSSSDPNSAQNLQTARKNVAHVYKNTHGRGFQSLNHLTARARAALRGRDPDAVAAYDSSRSAVNAAYHDRTDPTGGANHIYLYDLSPNSSQHVPSWVTNGNPTTVEGPFINAAGGGDVRAGDLVLILTIKDQ